MEAATASSRVSPTWIPSPAAVVVTCMPLITFMVTRMLYYVYATLTFGLYGITPILN